MKIMGRVVSAVVPGLLAGILAFDGLELQAAAGYNRGVSDQGSAKRRAARVASLVRD